MIEFFLKETFPKQYGVHPDRIVVPVTRKKCPFTEVDQKACDDAANKQYNKDNGFNKFEKICSSCDHVVLSLDNNNKEIVVVEFEKYINQFPAKISSSKKRCDLLMTDDISHNKIVFCDLCCYDSRYIDSNDGSFCPEGKRARARQQMEESIEFFMDVDVLNQYVLTYPEKICLFAYRDYIVMEKPVLALRGNAESNMQAMMTTASTISGMISTENEVMNHHFIFVQNKYPSVYHW